MTAEATNSVEPPAPSPQPALYIPHGGGPAFFMTGPMADALRPMAEFLATIHTLLPQQPDAIVVMSAHWEAATTTITAGDHSDLTYDYYGFPPETYDITYPAPGSPALAQRISHLLDEAGIDNALNLDRGWDHGVFIPLKVMYPEANIPVVAMSLRGDLDAAHELAVGRALAPLRNDNVLIVGSGFSFHNLSTMFQSGRVHDVSIAFDTWLRDAAKGDSQYRAEALTHWTSAPFAREVHPREEHLLPMMTAAGAGSDTPGRVIWSGQVNQVAVSAFAFD